MAAVPLHSKLPHRSAASAFQSATPSVECNAMEMNSTIDAQLEGSILSEPEPIPSGNVKLRCCSTPISTDREELLSSEYPPGPGRNICTRVFDGPTEATWL